MECGVLLDRELGTRRTQRSCDKFDFRKNQHLRACEFIEAEFAMSMSFGFFLMTITSGLNLPNSV
jgi:hypothetical protein